MSAAAMRLPGIVCKGFRAFVLFLRTMQADAFAANLRPLSRPCHALFRFFTGRIRHILPAIFITALRVQQPYFPRPGTAYFLSLDLGLDAVQQPLFAGSRDGEFLAGVGGARIQAAWLRQNENC